MYNRYIRNDNGKYTRITEDDGETRRPSNAPPPQTSGTPRNPDAQPSNAPPRNPAPGPPDAPPHGPAQPHDPPRNPAPPPMSADPPPRNPNPPRRPPPPPSAAPLQDALRGFLQRILNAAHMDNTDAGDLLTLCLLYLLYREGADEELLAALGLLLIL